MNPKMNKSALLCVTLMMMSWACGDTRIISPQAQVKTTPQDDVTAASTQDSATRAQPLTDATGPNWMAAGGRFSDLIGADGEPDAPAGRLVNNGLGVTMAARNKGGWFVVGPTGLTSLLDDDGKPQFGDLRTMLMGQDALVVSMGEVLDDQGTPLEEFLVGGKQGRVQRADERGQPKEVEKQLFVNGADVTAAGYYKGARQWLVGASDGQLQVIGPDLQVAAAAAPFTAAITAVVGSVKDNTQKRWLMISGEQFTYYPDPNPVTLSSGVTLTALGVNTGGQVAIGSADGKVALVDFDAVAANPTWLEVLGGRRVLGVEPNDVGQWLVYGEGGFAQLIDAQGQPMGQPRQVAQGAEITAATWAKQRWLLTTQSSYVIDLRADLTPSIDYATPLDGAAIMGGDVSGQNAIVVGEQGSYRVLDSRGKPLGLKKTLSGVGTLKAASWSGSSYLIGGEGGAAQLLDPQGEPIGAPLTLLGGEDIEVISWNGIFWFVGGAKGSFQRVRSDGTLTDNAARTLTGFDHIYGARWSGREWMVVGVKGSQGALQLIQQDGNPKRDALRLAAIPGPLYAVEWNGREWFMGGTGGLIQIVSAEGTPRENPMPMPRDILLGADIYSIDYHDEQFLVGGQRGLIIKMRDNLLTPSNPVSVLGFEDVRMLRWTKARGFAGGECLSSELCYNGQCIGGSIQAGFCCDRTCDKPCESCQQDFTGQPDGTCAPIEKDKRPNNAASCPRATETSCGLTGLCDGAGECQYYDSTISCQMPGCTTGVVTAEGFCDGAGACAVPESMSCAPYTICDGVSCGTMCTSTNDCAEGYRCVDKTCELIPEAPPAKPQEDGGCCSTVRPTPARSPWLLLGLGIFGLGLCRRRRSAR